MQTFLPYPNFAASAKCLDYRRLGKQRVEVLILLNSLYKPEKSKGWKNHPAREMWRGHENALVEYGLAICEEWKSRGYKDTCYEKIGVFKDTSKPTTKPTWIGDTQLHLSHKSNLIKKNPIHYKPFWPDIPDDVPYVWPVNKTTVD